MKKLYMTTFLGTVLLLSANTAQAGFEWAPAPAPEKAMTAPAPQTAQQKTPQNSMRATPMVSPEPRNMAPVMNGPATASAPPASMPMPVMGETPAAPVDMSGMSPVATVSPVSNDAIPPVQMKTYEDIQGFGSDVPLVTAMSQIVPADYAYSLDNNADLAKQVSWSGGAPWNEVLQNAVQPLGLVVSVFDDDNTVWIHNKNQPQKSAPRKNRFVEPMATTGAGDHAAHMQKSAMTPQEPIMVMPPASDVVPLTAPETKGSREKAIYNDNQGTHDAYPRRNPIPMMMKAESSASDKPQALNMAPPPALKESVNEGGQRMTPPPAPTMGMSASSASHSMATQTDISGSTEGSMVMAHNNTPSAMNAGTPRAPVRYEGDGDNVKLDPFEIRYWQAEKDRSLRSVLQEWGDMSGVQIRWNSRYDYRLPASLQTHATFPDAVTKILTYYQDLEPRPLGRLHPNLPEGPSILVIENYGTL